MVTGVILALIAALTFALNNAAYRRGALVGTVAQGMAISLGLGVVMFVAATFLLGAWSELPSWRGRGFWFFCAAGILHFAWGRYCNFRATKAMGANLVGPPQQMSLIVTLVLAILILGETLTPLRILGIALIVLGPVVSLRRGGSRTAPSARVTTFKPNYVEGYTFALLSATGYGFSPIFVRSALQDGDLAQTIAGGLVAYVAAALILTPILLLPGRAAHVAAVDRNTAAWFSWSGALVCISQMTTYAALAVAPVSVVVPVQRLSLVFRVFANSWLNREHEVIDGRVWSATVLGLLGAVALSLSTEYVLAMLPLPDWLQAVARWQWP